MKLRFLALLALLCETGGAVGEPAPYHWWVSQSDGTRICSQIPLGEGWIREAKPFRDSRCRVPLERR